MHARGNELCSRLKKGIEDLKLLITIDGHGYQVDVEVLDDGDNPPNPGAAPHHAAPSGAHSQGGVWDADGKICRSPLMGIVVKVLAESGQAIAAGQLLLVIEAMKMETTVAAPRAATVKHVHVSSGDSVKMHQVLVELE